MSNNPTTIPGWQVVVTYGCDDVMYGCGDHNDVQVLTRVCHSLLLRSFDVIYL